MKRDLTLKIRQMLSSIQFWEMFFLGGRLVEPKFHMFHMSVSRLGNWLPPFSAMDQVSQVLEIRAPGAWLGECWAPPGSSCHVQGDPPGIPHGFFAMIPKKFMGSSKALSENEVFFPTQKKRHFMGNMMVRQWIFFRPHFKTKQMGLHSMFNIYGQ